MVLQHQSPLNFVMIISDAIFAFAMIFMCFVLYSSAAPYIMKRSVYINSNSTVNSF